MGGTGHWPPTGSRTLAFRGLGQEADRCCFSLNLRRTRPVSTGGPPAQLRPVLYSTELRVAERIIEPERGRRQQAHHPNAGYGWRTPYRMRDAAEVRRQCPQRLESGHWLLAGNQTSGVLKLLQDPKFSAWALGIWSLSGSPEPEPDDDNDPGNSHHREKCSEEVAASLKQSECTPAAYRRHEHESQLGPRFTENEHAQMIEARPSACQACRRRRNSN